jgi:hypothetical protein
VFEACWDMSAVVGIGGSSCSNSASLCVLLQLQVCCGEICCKTMIIYEAKMCLLEVVTSECDSRRIFTEVTELKGFGGGWLLCLNGSRNQVGIVAEYSAGVCFHCC